MCSESFPCLVFSILCNTWNQWDNNVFENGEYEERWRDGRVEWGEGRKQHGEQEAAWKMEIKFWCCIRMFTQFCAARVTLVNLSFKMAALWMHGHMFCVYVLYTQCMMCGKHAHFIHHTENNFNIRYTILAYALIKSLFQDAAGSQYVSRDSCSLSPPQLECAVVGRSGYKLVVWETETDIKIRQRAYVISNITTPPHVHMSMYWRMTNEWQVGVDGWWSARRTDVWVMDTR